MIARPRRPPGLARVCIPIGPPLLVIGHPLEEDAAGTGPMDGGDDDLDDGEDAHPLPAPAGADSSGDD